MRSGLLSFDHVAFEVQYVFFLPIPLLGNLSSSPQISFSVQNRTSTNPTLPGTSFEDKGVLGVLRNTVIRVYMFESRSLVLYSYITLSPKLSGACFYV